MMKLLRCFSAVFALGLLITGIAFAGSGYKISNGTDLDSVFAPWHSGWPQAAVTGFKVNGVDIDARYAPLSTGSAAAATGFKSNGVDLNAIFAAAGSTGVWIAAQPGSVSGAAAAGYPSGTVTSNATSTAGAGGGGSYSYTWHIASGPGVNFTAPNSAVTSVTYSAVPAATTYSGTMYCTVSDGVTSANTNAVAWSLQNTSPASAVFQITAAQRVSGSNSWTGYWAQSPGLGSGTNLTLPLGQTVYALMDTTTTDGYQHAIFSVSGFSSDPGANWIASISAHGVTHTPGESDFVGETYSGGIATWDWKVYGTPAAWFGFASGSNYSATVVF